jgi:hypothetical protein
MILYTLADGTEYSAADGTLLALFSENFSLITDRSQLDVDRWRYLHHKGWQNMTVAERDEWAGEMKGRYDYRDWNRVESAVQSISEHLKNLGYLHGVLSINTGWTREDIPSVNDWDRYFKNVAALRDCIRVLETTPNAPALPQKFNYVLANNLEQILVDVDDVSTRIPKSWCYAGDIYLGEV